MATKSYIGYHGTNKEEACNIVSKNKFFKSNGEDEWLGKGIYFFEFEEDAHWWCREHNRLSSYSILEAKLVPNICINLVSSKSDLENFKKLCMLVKSKSPKKSDGRLRDNYLSLAIKLMIRENPPDMIIGGFDQNRKFWFVDKPMKDKFPLIICQIQYCVLNHQCIKEISQI